MRGIVSVTRIARCEVCDRHLKIAQSSIFSSQGMSASPCGFIGLGIMGEGMVRCLIKAGRNVVVWNRSSAKSHALRDEVRPMLRAAAAPDALPSQAGLRRAQRHSPCTRPFLTPWTHLDFPRPALTASPSPRRLPTLSRCVT
jgi:hypothetical protein